MNRGFAFKAIVRVLLVLLVFYLGLCSYAKWQAYRARKDAEAVSNLRPNLFLKQVLVNVLLAAEHIRNAARPEQESDLRQSPVSISLSVTNFVMARLLCARATLLL